MRKVLLLASILSTTLINGNAIASAADGAGAGDQPQTPPTVAVGQGGHQAFSRTAHMADEECQELQTRFLSAFEEIANEDGTSQ